MMVWLAAIVLVALVGVALLIVRSRGSARRPGPLLIPAARTSEKTRGEPRPLGPRWPTHLDLDPELTDDETRFRLVEGFGALGDPWAVAVLTQAYEEERDAAIRLRILEGLRDAVTPQARPALERAAGSGEELERSIAYEGLAALGAFDLVERGLDDPCVGVAQTACFELMRRGRRDRVASYLGQAQAQRAADLRVVIDVLDFR
jgi:HEAT repeat protein